MRICITTASTRVKSRFSLTAVDLACTGPRILVRIPVTRCQGLEDGVCNLAPRSVVYGGAQQRANGTLTGKRFGALINLRNRARRVLQSQNEGWPEAYRDDARRELNPARRRSRRLRLAKGLP